MSKKYQYNARKRNYPTYIGGPVPCKWNNPYNHTTCSICLGRVGHTRSVQKMTDKKEDKKEDKSKYIKILIY